jgi:hypothetical protein
MILCVAGAGFYLPGKSAKGLGSAQRLGLATAFATPGPCFLAAVAQKEEQMKPEGVENLTPQEIWDVAQQWAINEGVLEPRGLQERMAAGWMAYQGGSWASTPVAQQRLYARTVEILQSWGYTVTEG